MISILIVHYNRPDLLTHCLGSLNGAEDVVVVDNGSLNDSARAAFSEEFPEVTWVFLEENLGFSAGVNRAADGSSVCHAVGSWRFTLSSQGFYLSADIETVTVGTIRISRNRCPSISPNRYNARCNLAGFKRAVGTAAPSGWGGSAQSAQPNLGDRHEPRPQSAQRSTWPNGSNLRQLPPISKHRKQHRIEQQLSKSSSPFADPRTG